MTCIRYIFAILLLLLSSLTPSLYGVWAVVSMDDHHMAHEQENDCLKHCLSQVSHLIEEQEPIAQYELELYTTPNNQSNPQVQQHIHTNTAPQGVTKNYPHSPTEYLHLVGIVYSIQ